MYSAKVFALRESRFKALRPLVCTAILLLVSAQVVVQAQTVQVDRAQLVQSQTAPPYGPGVSAPGVDDGHAAASPNDADLGEQQILQRAPQYEPFTFSVGTPVFYTSNVALTPSHEMGDVVVAPVAGLYYDPQIWKSLYGHFGAREQVFYYGKYHGFDFGSLDAEAGLSYVASQLHNLTLRAEYDFNRLTFSDRLGDEFFSNHQIILNAELPFKLSQMQQLSLGADANLSVGADHQSPRRNDYEAYLAYSLFLSRAFSIDAGGRVVVRDYHQNDRTDVSEIVSLTASYRIMKWLTVSAISSFAHSDSNHDVFDYDVGNVGGAVSLAVKF